MYLYWPVVLIGVSVLVLVNPIRIFYYRSRMWLLYSLVSQWLRHLHCANMPPVAPPPCRYLSCRVARLLSW
jgi:hypothetical protein